MVAFTWPRVAPIPMYGTIRGGDYPSKFVFFSTENPGAAGKFRESGPMIKFSRLSIFTTWSNLPLYAFIWENSWTSRFSIFIGYICKFLIQNKHNVSGWLKSGNSLTDWTVWTQVSYSCPFGQLVFYTGLRQNLYRLTGMSLCRYWVFWNIQHGVQDGCLYMALLKLRHALKFKLFTHKMSWNQSRCIKQIQNYILVLYYGWKIY